MSRLQHRWYPPALRWWSLGLAVLLCWTAIAVLQFYLHKSQTDGGLIFATEINNVPLRRSFWYLYFPTILALVFSIFVVWIDHDAKRYEPYRLMSRADGALARDSILLHYPFDFMFFVPFVAATRGHWLVFWASLAAVLTTFGVVPLQAGLFSTKQIVRTYPETFAVSNKFVPAQMQHGSLGLRYAQSAYGIVELNETIPAFMALNYTLAPFKTKANYNSPRRLDTWIANTTMYSMDLQCQVVDNFTQGGCAKGCREFPTTYFNASPECTVGMVDFNNNTIGKAFTIRAGVSDGKARYRTFSAEFAGFFKDNLFPSTPNTTLQNSPCSGVIAAAFIRNKDKDTDPSNKIAAIGCKPIYYERDVEATVDAVTQEPLNLNYISDKRPLPEELFNISSFEYKVAAKMSSSDEFDRSDSLPGTALPVYSKPNNNPQLSLAAVGTDVQLPHMIAMAFSISKRQMVDYTDPLVLMDAYESAYKLLFARAMVDVLTTTFSDQTADRPGERAVRTETLLLEPVFTYLVECFLGLISVSALVLLAMSRMGSEYHKLIDEPGSIALAMSMVADDPQLLSTFEDLDCSSVPYMRRKLWKRVYVLKSGDAGPRISEIPPLVEAQQSLLHDGDKDNDRHTKAIKPVELRSFFAIPFTSFFVAAFIVLAVTYHKSQPQGLTLPSQNPIVYNIVFKYLPTAVATSIEPMWILISRILCVLQPLQRLQHSPASASASISSHYTSLPPQLMMIKALRSGHAVIASVCAMALLANLLATSFAGLFIQQEIQITQPTLFTPEYEAHFVNISRSSGSVWEGDQVVFKIGYGKDTDQFVQAPFLAAETNYTRNTTLPAWVDHTAMYVPFMIMDSTPQAPGGGYKARTKYFTAEPNCKALVFQQDYWLRTAEDQTPADGMNPSQDFTVKVPSKNGTGIWCYGMLPSVSGSSRSPFADQNLSDTPLRGNIAAELSVNPSASSMSSSYERDTCYSADIVGWMRTMDSSEATSRNMLMMSCQPRLVVGEADVHVDGNGILQSAAVNRTPDADQSPEALAKYTTNGVENIIAQSNRVLFRSANSGYHNDSFTGEKFHYFINKAAGTLRFTDPNTPLPTYEEVMQPLTEAYQRLFATWLTVNRDILFKPATAATAQIQGTTTTPEQRLFFVTPLFYISEVVLGIYIVISIAVYVRRPGAYLSRMPTSIAAIIALFASSAAVKDLQRTSHMKNRERERYLEDLGCSYGYGSFVGSDGNVHVGIEKMPFVRHRKKTTFEGIRIEKEGQKKGAGPTVTTVTEYVPVSLQDTDSSRM